MVHGPASTSGRFALRLNLVHIDKHHFEQVGAMQVGSQVIVLIVPMLWTFPPMREICRDCKVRADEDIASLVGLRQILKNLLEHGHVGLDCYCSPFHFQVSPDGIRSDTQAHSFYLQLSPDGIRSGSSVEGHLGLDAAALELARLHFNYKSGDHYVMPLVRLTGHFLSSMVLKDPLGVSPTRHPLWGGRLPGSATFVHMSTSQEVHDYLQKSWEYMRSRIADLETHAWMDQQRTNFMLLRASMQMLLHRYSFTTTNLCWDPMQHQGGFLPTLTPLMYEEVEVKK